LEFAEERFYQLGGVPSRDILKMLGQEQGIPLDHLALAREKETEYLPLIAQVERIAPNSPQLPSLRQQALFLEKSIQAETARVVGGPNTSLASKAQDFSRLAVQKEVAGTILAGAIAALEAARSDARRKVVYLQRIAQPSKPDVAMEPHRLRSIIATFLLGLILWGVLSLLVVAVKEHRH